VRDADGSPLAVFPHRDPRTVIPAP